MWKLALILVVLLPTAGQTQEAARATTLGWTSCDTLTNEPQININRNVVTLEQLDVVVLHEQEHVRQMNEYPGGCKEAIKRYMSDPDFAFSMELEAYCTDVNRVVAIGGDHDYAVSAMAVFLWQTYKPKGTFMELSARVGLECFKAPPDTLPKM